MLKLSIFMHIKIANFTKQFTYFNITLLIFLLFNTMYNMCICMLKMVVGPVIQCNINLYFNTQEGFSVIFVKTHFNFTRLIVFSSIQINTNV